MAGHMDEYFRETDDPEGEGPFLYAGTDGGIFPPRPPWPLVAPEGDPEDVGEPPLLAGARDETGFRPVLGVWRYGRDGEGRWTPIASPLYIHD